MLCRLGVLSHLGFWFLATYKRRLGEILIKTFSEPSAQFNIYSLPVCYRLHTVSFLQRDRQMSSCLCHMPGTILNNLPFHGGGEVMERSRKLPCSTRIELPLPSTFAQPFHKARFLSESLILQTFSFLRNMHFSNSFNR